jgi:hypothetical protein
MKTHWILFCLMIGCAAARGWVQQGFDYDKPSSVYIDNDTQKMDETDHARVDGWWDEGKTELDSWWESWNTTHYDHSWGDPGNDLGSGSGSSLTDDILENPSFTNTDTALCQEQMSWDETSATGNFTGYCAPSPNVPQPIGAPTVGSEHCDVNDPVPATTSFGFGHVFSSSYNEWGQEESDGTYTRNAQTKYKLRIGGKGVPGAQVLHDISGWAKDFEQLSPGTSTYKRAQPPYPFTIYGGGYGGTETSYGYLAFVPSQNVTIGSVGQLGNDGNLYKVFAAGAGDVDVTPKISGSDFYIFAVGDSESDPYITANGIDLDYNTPEFCVGQGVTFQLNGLGGYDSEVSHWSLPGDFVNESYAYSSYCTSYQEDDSLLQNTLDTSCWFINKPGGTVSIGVNLHFSNGQYVSIAAKGSFTVYRPTATMSFIQEPRYYTLSNTNLPTTTLKLGDGSGDGSMFYEVNVNSKYNGNANFTQLITADYSNPAYIFSVETCDGTEFYNDPSTRIIGSGIIGLDDGPSDTWVTPDIVNLSARDFVRFQPDGGIYVTLGIVTWDTVGTAEQSFSGNWSITTDTTPDPSGPDSSDVFPVWTQSVNAH